MKKSQKFPVIKISQSFQHLVFKYTIILFKTTILQALQNSNNLIHCKLPYQYGKFINKNKKNYYLIWKLKKFF